MTPMILQNVNDLRWNQQPRSVEPHDDVSLSDDYKPHVQAMMNAYDSFVALLPERATRGLTKEEATAEFQADDGDIEEL